MALKIAADGTVRLTRAEYAKIPAANRSSVKGKPHVMGLDPASGGTVLVPVTWTDTPGMTITEHERTEFSRAARAMYARGESALGHLLSAVASKKVAPLEQYDRAAKAYRAWLVFDEPKGRTRNRKQRDPVLDELKRLDPAWVAGYASEAETCEHCEKPIRKHAPVYGLGIGGGWLMIHRACARPALRAPNPKRRASTQTTLARGHLGQWLQCGLEERGRYIKRLAELARTGDGDDKAAAARGLELIERELHRMAGTPKGGSRRVRARRTRRRKGTGRPPSTRARSRRTSGRRTNPGDKETLARARKTFEAWHEYSASRVTRVRGKRVIPKTLVKLGELDRIDYTSDKFPGENGGRRVRRKYTHATSKPHPILCTGPDGKGLFIVGGNVKVTADGLVG